MGAARRGARAARRPERARAEAGPGLWGERQRATRGPKPGLEVGAIARASRFAALDPYRACTHNKGFMNGLDAAAVALGQDWRSIEAGAHAWAATGGGYRPLTLPVRS